jgi:O-antigen ligase
MDLATLELVQMAKVLLLFFIVANQIRGRDDLRLVLWALIATVAFESVLAIIQAASGKRLDLGFLGEAQNDKEAGKMYRVGGTLGHPNRLAMYLELLLPLTLGLFWTGKKKWHRFFAITVFGLGLIAMLLTGSRGGWIGLLFALVVFIYFVIKTKKLALRAILGPGLFALLILLGIAFAFSDVILHRFQGEDYGSAESRIPMIQIALNLIAANPIGGVGINNYQVVMHKYNNSIRALQYISIDRPVHNMYLLITGETGLIGFITFAILIFFLFKVLNRATKSRDLLLSITAASLFAGYAGFMVHGLVDKHSPGGYALFYVMLAVSAAVYYMTKREGNPE